VFEGLDKKTPILWLKYVDTDGPHVWSPQGSTKKSAEPSAAFFIV
jgi:hypothetical protein